MAVARIQVSTSLVGHEADYMKSVAETAALMQSKGLRNAVRVSHSGTPGIEVWSTTLFEDWREYGEATDMLLSDEDMQKMYMSTILNRTGELLDSAEMAEVPGFEAGVESSGDVIAATVWHILPDDGNAARFIGSCAQAKELHESHGGRPRLWQVFGGRFAGQMVYTLGFDSFTKMGQWQEDVKDAHAEFMSKQPVSAEIVAQMTLRPSTAI